MSDLDLMAAKRAVFRSDLRSLEKLVALALLDHWSRASNEPFPGVNRLAEWTSLDRTTVMRSLGQLEARGAIRIAKRNGKSNAYTLGQLERLPVAQRDRSQPPTGGTAPPPPVAESDGDQSQRATLSNQLSNPEKKPTSSAARKRSTPGSRKKDPEQPSAESHQLKTHYVDEFRKHRGGEDPDFGDSWSRAMQAFGKMCRRKGGLAAAKAVVSRALADSYVRRINPWELVDDWNKHVGPRPGQQALRVQTTGTDEGRARSWGRDGARALGAE